MGSTKAARAVGRETQSGEDCGDGSGLQVTAMGLDPTRPTKSRPIASTTLLCAPGTCSFSAARAIAEVGRGVIGTSSPPHMEPSMWTSTISLPIAATQLDPRVGSNSTQLKPYELELESGRLNVTQTAGTAQACNAVAAWVRTPPVSPMASCSSLTTQ